MTTIPQLSARAADQPAAPIAVANATPVANAAQTASSIAPAAQQAAPAKKNSFGDLCSKGLSLVFFIPALAIGGTIELCGLLQKGFRRLFGMQAPPYEHILRMDRRETVSYLQNCIKFRIESGPAAPREPFIEANLNPQNPLITARIASDAVASVISTFKKSPEDEGVFERSFRMAGDVVRSITGNKYDGLAATLPRSLEPYHDEILALHKRCRTVHASSGLSQSGFVTLMESRTPSNAALSAIRIDVGVLSERISQDENFKGLLREAVQGYLRTRR